MLQSHRIDTKNCCHKWHRRLIFAGCLTSQQPDSPLIKLRKLGLPEAPGSVPVIYVASAKDRALRLQKRLEDAHSWYERQLNPQVPIVLALLDPETREKISDTNALPHSFVARGGPGLVVIPASPNIPPPAGHEGWLLFESTQFHEDGHIDVFLSDSSIGGSSHSLICMIKHASDPASDFLLGIHTGKQCE